MNPYGMANNSPLITLLTTFGIVCGLKNIDINCKFGHC